MYRDAAAQPEVLVTVRPYWRARPIRGVIVVAAAALLFFFILRTPMTTIHLVRDDSWGTPAASGELCQRRVWMDCGPVSTGDGSVNGKSLYVFDRRDASAWLHASASKTFDVSDGGVPYLPAAIVVLVMAGAALVVLRRRIVRLVRIGPELRIENGRRTSSVLLREVRSVELESASVNLHGIAFVLGDGRRIAIGAPSFRMTDALVMRQNLRAALELAINSRSYKNN